MFNWFNIILALIVGSIVLTIIKTVRQTKTVIDKNLKDVDSATRDEIAKKLLQKISTQDIDLSRFDDPVAAQIQEVGAARPVKDAEKHERGHRETLKVRYLQQSTAVPYSGFTLW